MIKQEAQLKYVINSESLARFLVAQSKLLKRFEAAEGDVVVCISSKPRITS